MRKNLRIVFMGTPEFAVPCLAALLRSGYQVVGVVTAPDKPAGRGQVLQQSAVKKFAVDRGLPVLQPGRLKDPEFIEALRSLNANIQFVVAFRMLPEAVWNMPALGTYNLHGSLLPKYRGAAPINWAIIRGETETGVTTFRLQHEIDSGNILLQEKIRIGAEETAGELHDRMMEIGAELLVRTADALQQSVNENTPLPFMPQDESQVTHAPKIFRETCRINWAQPARDVHNLIRGLSPYPAAWCELNNGDIKQVKIYRSRITAPGETQTNGSLLTDNRTFLRVSCADGTLDLLELQLEGKKRLPVEELLKGFKIKEGASMI